MEEPSSAPVVGEDDLLEAQEEAAKLRTELYSTRRTLWDAKSGRSKAEAECSALNNQVMQLQQALEEAQWAQETAEKRAARSEEAAASSSKRCAEAEQAYAVALREREEAVAARQTAEGRAQAAEESCNRAQSAATTASADRHAIAGEREAWHRARDELSAQLRLSQRRAQELEEEQCRAEEESSALQAELEAVRSELELVQNGGVPRELEDGAEAGKRSPWEEERSQLLLDLEQERGKAASANRQLAQVQTPSSSASSSNKSSPVSAATGLVTLSRAGTGVRLCTLAQQEQQNLEDDLDDSAQDLADAKAQVLELQRELRAAQVSSAAVPAKPQDAADGSAASPSLPDAPSTSGEQEAAMAELQEQSKLREEQLNSQIKMLEATRRKLLGELDQQSLEIDRLFDETGLLAKGLSEAKAISETWEGQVQQSMAMNERLQEMLTEQAMWPVPGKSDSATDELPPEPSSGTAAGFTMEEAQKLEEQIIREKALSTKLQLKVDDLSVQLTKATAKLSDLQRTYHPLLGAIEGRLLQLKRNGEQSGAKPTEIIVPTVKPTEA
ncbi:hypothetical protein CYMTET_46845 [Cymbomonas tetramitiformis]|uniref:Uncharacterized protein n=1 Tax=Cymbomonas tetramitiformis TaxID=36881 RepID=A0AAE0BX60_9CHLO|nr:hypothetical protein CYMTET_46845 [Cymbomonas tetramitiformis]